MLSVREASSCLILNGHIGEMMRGDTVWPHPRESDVINLTNMSRFPYFAIGDRMRQLYQIENRNRRGISWISLSKSLLTRDRLNTLRIMANLESGLRNVIHMRTRRAFFRWKYMKKGAEIGKNMALANVSIQCDKSKLSDLNCGASGLDRYESGGLFLVKSMFRRWIKRLQGESQDEAAEHDAWKRMVKRFDKYEREKALSEKANTFSMRRLWVSMRKSLVQQDRLHSMKVVSTRHHAAEMMRRLVERYVAHRRHAACKKGVAALEQWRKWTYLVGGVRTESMIRRCMEEVRVIDTRCKFRKLVHQVLLDKKRKRFLVAKRKLEAAIATGKAKKCAERCFRHWMRRFIARSKTEKIIHSMFAGTIRTYIEDVAQKSAAQIQAAFLARQKAKHDRLFMIRKFLLRWRIRMRDIMKQGTSPEFAVVVNLPIKFDVKAIVPRNLLGKSQLDPLRTVYDYHAKGCNELAGLTAVAACKRFKMVVPKFGHVFERKSEFISRNYVPNRTIENKRSEAMDAVKEIVDINLDLPLVKLTGVVARKAHFFDGHESQYRSRMDLPKYNLNQVTDIDWRLDSGTAVVKQSLQKAKRMEIRKRVKAPECNIDISVHVDFHNMPICSGNTDRNAAKRSTCSRREAIPSRDLHNVLDLNLGFSDLTRSVPQIVYACMQSPKRLTRQTVKRRVTQVTENPLVDDIAKGIRITVNPSNRRQIQKPGVIALNLRQDLVNRCLRPIRLGHNSMCQKAVGKVFLPTLPVFDIAFGTSFRPHRRRLHSDERIMRIVPFDVKPFVSTNGFDMLLGEGKKRNHLPELSDIPLNIDKGTELARQNSTEILRHFSLPRIPKCASPQRVAREVLSDGSTELLDHVPETKLNTCIDPLRSLRPNLGPPPTYTLPGAFREFIDTTLYGDLQVIGSYINEAFVWPQRKHRRYHTKPVVPPPLPYDSDIVRKNIHMTLDALVESTAISALWTSFAATFKNLKLRHRRHRKRPKAMPSTAEQNRKMFNFIGRI